MASGLVRGCMLFGTRGSTLCRVRALSGSSSKLQAGERGGKDDTVRLGCSSGFWGDTSVAG